MTEYLLFASALVNFVLIAFMISQERNVRAYEHELVRNNINTHRMQTRYDERIQSLQDKIKLMQKKT